MAALAMAVLASGPRISNVIDGHIAAVGTLMQQHNGFTGTSESPLLEAASAVGLAIGNASVAWNQHLSLTADKVDAKVRGGLAELQAIVDMLKAREEIVNVSSRVQQFIDSLPLTKWQPKLTAICPRYITVEKSSFTVSFSGKFPYAHVAGSSLRVMGAGQTRGFDEATPSSLSFTVQDVPKLFPEQALTNCWFIRGTLQVNYWVGNLKPYYTGEYVVWMGVFPLCPLRNITLTSHRKEVVNTIEREFRSATQSLSRADFPGLKPDDEVIRDGSILPSPDWKFKIKQPPIIHYKEIKKEGDPVISQRFFVAAGHYAMEFINTRIILGKEVQHVEIYVEAKETQDVVEMKQEQKSVTLKRGEMHRFATDKDFMIQCEEFSGKKFELTARSQTPAQPPLPLRVVHVGGGAYELIADGKKQTGPAHPR